MDDAALVVENLCKSFGALRASDNVGLTIRADEIHALIGPNGAGKSTLIQLIAGSLTPDEGRVTLFGEDISNLSVAQRACRGLGRSFQISSLIPEFSALRNVMLAVQATQGSSFRFFRNVNRDDSLIAPAMAALENVGLRERSGVIAAELSHGERRKLEIAIALALKAKVFLFDEPMAGMGLEGSKELMSLLENLRRQAAILLIEHDMDAVFSLADRISVLVYGRVIATGSVAEIRKNPEVRRAYLGEGH